MKRMLYAVIVVLVIGTGHAHAKGVSLDFGLKYASEPAGDFGATFGPEIGVNIDFDTFVKARKGSKLAAIGNNIKFRIDLGYYKWEDDVAGVDIEYRRIPLFVGGRYFFPIPKMNQAGWQLFGEGGLEASYDRVEAAVPFTTTKVSDTKTHYGAAVGGGILYAITDRLFAGATGRFHAVTDSYMTLGLFFGFRIP